MDELRTILIVLGIVLVIGIYLVDRMRRRRASRPPRDWDEIESFNEEAISEEEGLPQAEQEVDPDEWVGKAFIASRNDVLDDAQLEGLKGLGSSEGDSLGEGALPHSERPATEGSAEGDKAHTAPAAEEVIVLTLMARTGKKLRGPLLLKALQESGLSHGDMGIFHFHVDGHSEPLFSLANILEPGRFELSEMAQLETPGVALFMRLPAPLPGTEALDMLLQKARQLAALLNAEICDSQRQPLEASMQQQLRDKASRFPAAE